MKEIEENFLVLYFKILLAVPLGFMHSVVSSLLLLNTLVA